VRVDADARNVQFYAGSVIAIVIPMLVPMLVAVVPLAVDALVNDLVPVALADAPRSADIPAANLTAHPGDRFGEAELDGRAAQAGRARRSPGIRLT
jgi:hypothetical protein